MWNGREVEGWTCPKKASIIEALELGGIAVERRLITDLGR